MKKAKAEHLMGDIFCNLLIFVNLEMFTIHVKKLL